MVVSFIGGGNQSTRRKPSTCRKSMTICITSFCIGYTSPEVRTHTLVVKIYSQRIIHLYYLSTMSTCFLHDLFYFISLFEVKYSDILNKELLWLWTLISCLTETNVAGEDILTKENNYDFNIQIRGRYWLTVFELDTWASNIFINHRFLLILFQMSLKDMARTSVWLVIYM